MVAAGEQQDKQEHDQGEGDDAGDLDPAWGACRRATIRAVLPLGGGGVVSHGGSWSSGGLNASHGDRDSMSLSSQSVAKSSSRIVTWCRGCGTRRSRRTPAGGATPPGTPPRPWGPSTGWPR